MSKDDYNALQETIYLYGLADSILDADKQDPKKMKKYSPTEEWKCIKYYFQNKQIKANHQPANLMGHKY